MKTQTIHARVSPDVKKASEKILEKIGLTMSEAISLFLKQMVNRQQFPLELKIPNKETIKAIKDSHNRKNLTSYNSVDELFKDLSTRGKKNRNNQKVSKRLSTNGKAGQGSTKVTRNHRIIKRRKTSARVMPLAQA